MLQKFSVSKNVLLFNSYTTTKRAYRICRPVPNSVSTRVLLKSDERNKVNSNTV